jgi:hypothetical protein
MALILDGSNGTTGNLANGDLQVNGVTVGKGAGTIATNTAVGVQALNSNTTATNNTALGYQAGNALTTGSYNTFVGDRAGISTTTASYCTAFGTEALRSNTTGRNTAIGIQAGYSNTTGTFNTFIGDNAGANVTTGSKNTTLGCFNGNQGGVDIRTASNNIVLSDGDGNPRFNYISSTKNWRIPYLGGTNTGKGTNSLLSFSSGSNTYDGSIAITDAVANNVWWGLLSGNAYVMVNSNGVQLSSGATAWASASDYRLKNITGTYTNALSDIAQIEPVKFTWKSDDSAIPQVGVIAQSVQNVVPEAIAEVTEQDEKYLSVRYTELIPLMIASIQQLNAKVDAQAARIAALESAKA